MTGGFDPSTFDPSTFDPSTIDLSALLPEGFDPENPDPSLLLPQPVEVSQVIGTAGGEISVTGGNGVVYTLAIPGGALLEDVLITLSPVENIEGIPFSGGFLAGVLIGPRELEFEVPALLTFILPEGTETPAESEHIAFGYENMGEDFHLEPVARNADELAARMGGGTKLASPEEQVSSVTIYMPVKKTGGRGATSGSARERPN